MSLCFDTNSVFGVNEEMVLHPFHGKRMDVRNKPNQGSIHLLLSRIFVPCQAQLQIITVP